MPQTLITADQADPIDGLSLSIDLKNITAAGGVRDYIDTVAVSKTVVIADSSLTSTGTDTAFSVNQKLQRISNEYWNFSFGFPTGDTTIDPAITTSGLLLSNVSLSSTAMTVLAGSVMPLRTYSKQLLSMTSNPAAYVDIISDVLGPVTAVDTVEGVYHVSTATWPYGIIAQHPYLEFIVVRYDGALGQSVLDPLGPNPFVSNTIVALYSTSLTLGRRSDFAEVAVAALPPGAVTINVPSPLEYRVISTPTSTTMQVRVPTDVTVTFNQDVVFPNMSSTFPSFPVFSQANLDDCYLVSIAPPVTIKIVGSPAIL